MYLLSRKTLWVIVLLITAVTCSPPPGHAETNSARGGIGEIDNGTLSGGDGTGGARFTIEIVDLALVKQARQLSGAVLPDNADVDVGEEIYFVLYVSNPTPHPSHDLRITDPINEEHFTYIPNSLEMTLLSDDSGETDIWSGRWNRLTDDIGSPDDVASIVDSDRSSLLDMLTIGAVEGQANRTIGVPGESTIAFRFRVRVH